MWLKLEIDNDDTLTGDVYVNLAELRRVEVVRHFTTPRRRQLFPDPVEHAGKGGDDIWNVVGVYGATRVERVVLATFSNKELANGALKKILLASYNTIQYVSEAPQPSLG
jgi:hypothetical protein